MEEVLTQKKSSLKLTASLPLKTDGWKMEFHFGMAYFQGLSWFQGVYPHVFLLPQKMEIEIYPRHKQKEMDMYTYQKEMQHQIT